GGARSRHELGHGGSLADAPPRDPDQGRDRRDARTDPARAGRRDRRLGESRGGPPPVDGGARRPDHPRPAAGRDAPRPVRRDRGQVLAAGPLTERLDPWTTSWSATAGSPGSSSAATGPESRAR